MPTRFHVATGPTVQLRAGQALATALGLLLTLDRVGRLSAAGLVVGIGASAAGLAVLVASAVRQGHIWGPADDVTLIRAVLAAGLAALAVGSTDQPQTRLALLLLAAPALLLDGVDGWVARRTATSRFGARFDMETDAFVILALSTAAAQVVGPWVLAIGLARYVLLTAAWVLPWLRAETPPRSWAKTVAVVQVVVLMVTISGLAPPWLSRAALVIALGLLGESFLHQVRTLWRMRPDRGPGGLVRRTVCRCTPWLAVVVVWLSLVVPDRPGDVRASAGLRIPVELPALIVLVVLLPGRWARRLLVIVGTAVGVLLVLRLADVAFYAVMDRPFDPLGDWTFLLPGVDVLADSIGQTPAVGAAAALVLAVVLIVVLVPAATLRAGELARAHGRPAVAVAAALTVVGTASWLAQVLGALPGSSTPGSVSGYAYSEIRMVAHDFRDREVFAAEIDDDTFKDVPGDHLLGALRGKDVLLVFVESYGRVAVQGTTYSAGVSAVLDAGSTQLVRDGYRSRSAFLTSPTFGAASWLAHSTLQSGLWVDSQRRYDQLLSTDRLTLTRAFAEAGWRTVFDVPSIREPWPDGRAFYGFDQLYDAGNVGYRGPEFGYASMPDQYTLDTFRRRELATGGHRPVMAEIDLVSSHHPWAPLPRLVPWGSVGDGSVFDPMPALGESSEAVLADTARVRDAYGRSVQYSWQALISWLHTYRDPNLVLIVLGDHQPHGYVTGPSPGHDVPVTLIWSDPSLDKSTSAWSWDPGLRPFPNAPVWRMDTFRDRFLSAFDGPTSAPDTGSR